MNYYKLRVHLRVENPITSQDILNLVSGYSETYCYAIEKLETNPHIQFYIETHIKSPTIRSHLRKMGLKGNASYSLTNCEKDPIEYIAYLTKENFYQNTITDEIMEQVENYKKDKTKTKNKKPKILDYLLDTYKEKYWIDGVYPINDSKIIYEIVEYHIENKLIIRKFQIQSYLTTMQIYLYKEKYPNDVKHLVDYYIEKLI